MPYVMGLHGCGRVLVVHDILVHLMIQFYKNAVVGAKTRDTLVNIVVYASKCKSVGLKEYNDLCRAVYSKVV